MVADKPLRDAFNLLVKVFNGRQRAKKERVIEALVKVEGHLKQAEKVITELLGILFDSSPLYYSSASISHKSRTPPRW